MVLTIDHYCHQQSSYRKHVFVSILVGPKIAEYTENDVEEVGEDGNPHEAEEIEHLAQSCQHLWRKNRHGQRYTPRVVKKSKLRFAGRKLFGETSSWNTAP